MWQKTWIMFDSLFFAFFFDQDVDGFEKVDAMTYASWGVDYVKEDSCYASGDHQTAFEEYGRMRDALNGFLTFSRVIV